MRVPSVLVTFLLGVILVDRYAAGEDLADKSWISQMKKLRSDLRDCYQSGIHQSLWSCFRSRSLHIFEGIMSSPEISIYDGVRLVAAPNSTDNATRPDDERKDLKHLTWFDQLAVSLAKGLTTHTLQVNLGKLTERYLSSGGFWLAHTSFIIH